jgi:hypothetical protein
MLYSAYPLRQPALYTHLVKTGRPYWAHYLIINLIYKQIVPTGLNAA